MSVMCYVYRWWTLLPVSIVRSWSRAADVTQHQFAAVCHHQWHHGCGGGDWVRGTSWQRHLRSQFTGDNQPVRPAAARHQPTHCYSGGADLLWSGRRLPSVSDWRREQSTCRIAVDQPARRSRWSQCSAIEILYLTDLIFHSLTYS